MEVNRRFFESMLADKKMSLRSLASKMGMSHSQLSLTFSGSRRMTLDEAAQLSQIFSVPLHVIVENAGVTVNNVGARRVSVIGAMKGDGTVELYERGVIERATAPEGVPDDAVAVQCRTASSALEWMDGAVMFCPRPDGVQPAIIGRLCLAQLKDGPAVVGLVKRGYRDGTWNLSGPFQRESAAVEWASPILLTRN